MAEINVRFIADLVSVTRSADGVVVAGHPQEIVEARDLWTFACKISSAEPDWRVIATDTAC
jgi:predicted lipid-binding transport protein (Tim44 family)